MLKVLAGSAALFAIAIASALAGGSAKKQTIDYRYTGAVEIGRGIPSHYARAGEGFAFSFYDALRLGVKSEPYRVCIGRAGKASLKCWKQSARFGVGKVSLGATLPPEVPLGALTVRWSVEGRTVAKWGLLYVHGGG
jgi:hypothetical protein